jgi:hypothetical protein
MRFLVLVRVILRHLENKFISLKLLSSDDGLYLYPRSFLMLPYPRNGLERAARNCLPDRDAHVLHDATASEEWWNAAYAIRGWTIID